MLNKTAPLLVILAGCMWGAIGTFVRIMSAMGLDSTTIVECRIFGAMLMLVAGLLIYDKKLLNIKVKDIWIFIGAGLLCTALFNTFYNIAINELTLSLAAILLCTAPFFVILLARVFFGEKITSRKIKTLLLAFCGCVLVCGIFDQGATLSVRGILIGILAGIDYAFFSIFARVAINKGYHTLTISTWSFICASLGNVREGQVNSSIEAAFRNAHVYNKEECSDCWAKFYCSGGCHANAHLFNDTI
jgi:DME family drug/metabolite transporter